MNAIVSATQTFKGKCNMHAANAVAMAIPKTKNRVGDVFVKNIEKTSNPRFSFKNLRFKNISKIYSQIFRRDISVEESASTI